ncbi:hydroxysqualene dehydroxylase HpnE [Rubrivivax gelatinosus]|uniref:Squalene-associated FAD-dependent desaturase n=1 Tax=Rubrivivax gelatinosus TaxID=28068 RepID=A0A4R2MND7_RUBGE|nr:hydroxysqualene dehydroxylase HpnE [Rubrivivax gelatinosus]TCP04586.1 squalene-associated FAD-dependent desaturase [Rubrivivax gelatinosus]
MTARVAVIGAGWAGLAAAVRLAGAGVSVAVLEMAPQPGGRARSLTDEGGERLDNGQHILIGAYTRTLALMEEVGADPQTMLSRTPLMLRRADGSGIEMPRGAPVTAFVRGVASARGWTWRDKASLLATAAGWAARGFRCAPTTPVAALCEGLSARVRAELIDPLCVAALNTPASEASAAVMLRVLRDALFGGRGAADLLLPRRPLSELLPEPAATWLLRQGAELRCTARVASLESTGPGWRVGGERFDAVVLAASALEAARLTAGVAPAWSRAAAALRYEPIVTVYLDAPGCQLPCAMTTLDEGPEAPAQFAFDHGLLGGVAGRSAWVVSGARTWVERGLESCAAAVLRQAQPLLPGATLRRVLAEKRATFRCTPGLVRPPAQVAPRLWAAGDYIDGPYPATLEGAVRAGETAAAQLLAQLRDGPTRAGPKERPSPAPTA